MLRSADAPLGDESSAYGWRARKYTSTGCQARKRTLPINAGIKLYTKLEAENALVDGSVGSLGGKPLTMALLIKLTATKAAKRAKTMIIQINTGILRRNQGVQR